MLPTMTDAPAPEPTDDTTDTAESVPPIPAEQLASIEKARQRFVTALNNPVAPTQEEKNRVEAITDSIIDQAAMLEFLLPECRDKSLALTALEEVSFRANRAIYLKDPIGGRKPAPFEEAMARLQAEREAQP